MHDYEDAVSLAASKHKGQKDKAGEPYIRHLMRVSLAQTDEDAQIVGILHDIVEDTDMDTYTLAYLGFSPAIVSAIDSMTHRANEPYTSYIERVGRNPLATRVKLADLHDNMNMQRLVSIGQADIDRFNKYKNAERYLRTL